MSKFCFRRSGEILSAGLIEAREEAGAGADILLKGKYEENLEENERKK